MSWRAASWNAACGVMACGVVACCVVVCCVVECRMRRWGMLRHGMLRRGVLRRGMRHAASWHVASWHVALWRAASSWYSRVVLRRGLWHRGNTSSWHAASWHPTLVFRCSSSPRAGRVLVEKKVLFQPCPGQGPSGWCCDRSQSLTLPNPQLLGMPTNPSGQPTI